ncbi:exopolysaccharide biosynthesis protein [Pelagibius sp. 7325]|uniref:exopolysaccharide biosynthesis protein n=1 Tax=Pelagibius sp. 7325 TaxID=3131994 RepID=UPI0030ED1DE7
MGEISPRPDDARSLDDLESLLEEIGDTADAADRQVTVGDLLDRIGTRSFGAFLLLPALIAFTPLGGIPGLPTAMAAVVIVIAGQLVIGLDHFWLPDMILRRSVKPDKLRKSADVLQRPARWADKLIRPRLTGLTREPFVHLAAFACILLALTVPPLEIVPFAGSVSWAAIGIFGLALIARDGLLSLIALGFSLGAGWVVYRTLL